jgi:hypothetical protein
MQNAILAEWPEWKIYLQTSPAPRAKGFWFIIPAPNKDITRGLSISIDGRRVIVGFDDDHDHLWQRSKESLPRFRTRVLEKIHDLMNDKIVAMSWRDKKGRLRVSNCFKAEDKISQTLIQSGYTKRIRPWSGKHDRNVIEV